MSTQTITEHKKCICVEFGDTNNNKVWQYTLYNDGTALTEWGRVGKGLQNKIVSHSQALKKWGEKTNPNNKPDKRYTEVKAIDTGSSITVSGSIKNAALKDVARKQIKSSNPLVSSLIDYLVKVNAHQIMQQSGGKITYDATSAQFKTPLGVIAPDQVSEARDLLVDIADFVATNDFTNSRFNSTLNAYLRLIPHDVGMTKITPQRIFPNTQTIIAENDLLDGLETSFIDVTTKPKKKTTKKKDDTPQIFNVELEIVTDQKAIDRINKRYEETKRGNHSCSHLRLKKVYSVFIHSSKERFDKVAAQIGNIHELYHGTSSQNLLAILKQGFKVSPPSTVHITGKMFGSGTYTAPSSSKALNYSYGYWSGQRNNRCFMFLVDVICGKVYTPRSYNESFPKPGYDSTWAKANISGVMNDEVIVYQDDRCNPTYLLEFN